MNLLLTATEATLTTSDWSFTSGNIYATVLMIVMIVLVLVILLSAITIDRALKSMIRITMPQLAMEEEAKKRNSDKKTLQEKWDRFWNRFLQLKPIEEEKDMVIDHEYDGIQELDNPIPTWFNALFYGTITFGFIYLLVYHVFGWGMNQDQEYIHEMSLAEKAKQEYLAQAANLIDENSITVDPTMATAGKSIFIANCAACHGNEGQGGIGPNLTDKHWLHGAEIKDVFKTVKYGIPEKGMVPWEQTLTPGQIAEVSNFILTLRGTTPPNAKAAEGVEVEYETGSDDSDDNAN